MILKNLWDCYRKVEEGLDNDKSVWPLWSRLHVAYISHYNKYSSSQEQGNLKKWFCQDWGLKFDLMNLEYIVIVDQNSAVNMPLSFTHTARQVSQLG